MLKRLDTNAKSFIGKSGAEYFIEMSMNTERFKEFEKLTAHVGFGIDFKGIFDKLKELYELLNKQKFADAAVMTHNLMHGIKKNLDNRAHPAMLLLTLFVNKKDEDRSVWTEDIAAAKVEDWVEYDVQDFFSLAVNLVPGLMTAYNEVILNTLEVAIPDTMNTMTKES